MEAIDRPITAQKGIWPDGDWAEAEPPGRLTIDRDGRERHVTHDLAVLHGDQ